MFHYTKNEYGTDYGSPDYRVNFFNLKLRIVIVFHYKENEYGTDYGSPDYQVIFFNLKLRIVIVFLWRRMSMEQTMELQITR